jgi:hypothetical protein
MYIMAFCRRSSWNQFLISIYWTSWSMMTFSIEVTWLLSTNDITLPWYSWRVESKVTGWLGTFELDVDRRSWMFDQFRKSVVETFDDIQLRLWSVVFLWSSEIYHWLDLDLLVCTESRSDEDLVWWLSMNRSSNLWPIHPSGTCTKKLFLGHSRWHWKLHVIVFSQKTVSIVFQLFINLTVESTTVTGLGFFCLWVLPFYFIDTLSELNWGTRVCCIDRYLLFIRSSNTYHYFV